MHSGLLVLESRRFRIQLSETPERLWSYQAGGCERRWDIQPPVFEIDGQSVVAALTRIKPIGAAKPLESGAVEQRFEGVLTACAALRLEMVFRFAQDDPVVRFRYILKSAAEKRLTKRASDPLTYLSFDASGLSAAKEIRFSDFNEQVHSYCLTEQALDDRHFLSGCRAMGPMLVGERGEEAMLVAYEHGSRYPNAFLDYRLASGGRIYLQAVKGNFCDGQVVDSDHPFETIWFEFAAVLGREDDLARAYRHFVLRHLCENAETRKPYLFYNTWGYQELNKYRTGASYAEPMNVDHVLKEIDAAHRLGIEVFVLDSGWYDRLGDWRVNPARFPDALKTVRARLDEHGMKLGLWFAPNMVSLASRMYREHPECAASMHGKSEPYPLGFEDDVIVWACLVSDFRDVFADELIRLIRETGVSYFKWDMLDQRGCDAPLHRHGGPENSEQERADCFAFRFPLDLMYIADRVTRECPGAIVDYDVTEERRAFGLGFLSVGKYFLINNGPYYKNYDIPATPGVNPNILTMPGPARGWICRAPLLFDRWIPSVLFLTHYRPDEPEASQWVNIGSLVLGQNGIWGDLTSLSEESVARLGAWLGVYKQVRDDITRSSLIREGTPGGSPEIYEKIDEGTGRGVVVAFASTPGRFEYITRHAVSGENVATPGVTVERDARGRGHLRFDFDRAGARFAFFGARSRGSALLTSADGTPV